MVAGSPLISVSYSEASGMPSRWTSKSAAGPWLASSTAALRERR